MIANIKVNTGKSLR